MNLSIVIPVKNRVDKLCRLLSSIPLDSAIEVIVVDDGSEHSIEYLSEEYLHVTVISNSKGKGAGGARNTGLAYAQGKYVLFADSDDIFLPDFAAKVFRYIELESDIVFFAPQSFLETQPTVLGRRHLKYKRLVESYVKDKIDDLRYYFYVPWSKLIRREFLIRNSIEFEEVSASNDVNFSLAIGLKAETIYATMEGIYSVEESNSSLTKESSKSKLITRIEVVHRFNATLISYGLKNKRIMVLPWLYKLFLNSPLLGIKYLIKSLCCRTPLFFDQRFKK